MNKHKCENTTSTELEPFFFSFSHKCIKFQSLSVTKCVNSKTSTAAETKRRPKSWKWVVISVPRPYSTFFCLTQVTPIWLIIYYTYICKAAETHSHSNSQLFSINLLLIGLKKPQASFKTVFSFSCPLHK